MKGCIYAERTHVCVGWVVAVVVVATAFPLTACGAERVVLGEYFTNLG